MSRSLRTIPAGALAACAVVLLTSPQAEAVATRAGRPAATAPRPAVSAHPRPAGQPGRGNVLRPPAGPPHGWGGQRARGRDEAAGPDPAAGRFHHGWGEDRRAARSRRHRPEGRDDEAGAPARRPHGVPGESPTALYGAAGGAEDGRGDGDSSVSGNAPRGPWAVDGPAWPAPVAPPDDPLLDSGVWRPAGSAHDQALDQPARVVGQTATAMAAAPVLPVLTFGAGLTSLGLGIAFFALRLRRG